MQKRPLCISVAHSLKHFKIAQTVHIKLHLLYIAVNLYAGNVFKLCLLRFLQIDKKRPHGANTILLIGGNNRFNRTKLLFYLLRRLVKFIRPIPEVSDKCVSLITHLVNQPGILPRFKIYDNLTRRISDKLI